MGSGLQTIKLEALKLKGLGFRGLGFRVAGKLKIKDAWATADQQAAIDVRFMQAVMQGSGLEFFLVLYS